MNTHSFSGHIYLFHSFDVGDDIQLDLLKEDSKLVKRPLAHPKYFKNYHTPLNIELPHPHRCSYCESTKIYNFGVISVRYKIPFVNTLELLKQELIDITYSYNERAVEDAHSIFKKISYSIKQPRFFHLSNLYVLVQVTPERSVYDGTTLKETFGNEIASLVRFETENLSAHQKNEVLGSSLGYYRGDLLVIDTDASFVYDDDYEEIVDIFEFASLQQLELHYFDRLLDQQLNAVFNREVGSLPLSAYLPFWGTLKNDPVGDLGKLRVDISVIIERITSNIKLVGEPYISELYAALSKKLDLQNWRDSLNKKLDIVQDIRQVYVNKVDTIREDLLSVLVIILIFLELLSGFFHYGS